NAFSVCPTSTTTRNIARAQVSAGCGSARAECDPLTANAAAPTSRKHSRSMIVKSPWFPGDSDEQYARSMTDGTVTKHSTISKERHCCAAIAGKSPENHGYCAECSWSIPQQEQAIHGVV